jgi:hypothetical protein
VVPLTLGGAAGAAGAGFGTARLALPALPSLIGSEIFTQVFVRDSGAVAGFAASRGARLVVH